MAQVSESFSGDFDDGPPLVKAKVQRKTRLNNISNPAKRSTPRKPPSDSQSKPVNTKAPTKDEDEEMIMDGDSFMCGKSNCEECHPPGPRLPDFATMIRPFGVVAEDVDWEAELEKLLDLDWDAEINKMLGEDDVL